MLRKHDFYETEIWPHWLDEFRQSPDRVVFLHGIMGSELYERESNDTLWVDTGVWHEVDNLEYQSLTPDGAVDVANQFVYARSTVRPPIVSDPYAELLAEIRPGRFNYDWRESIPIEARRLRLFLKKLTESEEKVNLITHSMGGCMLLWLLASTQEFDEKIGKIIFCAPPFHGALKPIRVIEDGNGTPIDLIIRNSVLRRSAATIPGLFQLLVAPTGSWVTNIKNQGQVVARLKHPIRTGDSLYRAGAWTNRERLDLRSKILQFAEQYHMEKWQRISQVINRLAAKIHVIVGLNGKTTCCATRSVTGDWVLHKVPAPPDGKISNGDGTVLFQSTLLPELPEDHYWAEIPNAQENTHGGVMDRPKVIAGIKAILKGNNPVGVGLENYSNFIQKIDWSYEHTDRPDPGLTENLDYIEREHLRGITPKSEWHDALNPDGNDAELFASTRGAAFRVLHGDDLQSAATRIGEKVEFLEGHLRTLLMPLLYS